MSHRTLTWRALAVIAGLLIVPGVLATAQPLRAVRRAGSGSRMQKRWLFVWRDMSDPKEVDRMIARFARAKADGYNGVAFSYNIPASKAPELKQAAKQNGLDLIAIVMNGSHDRNYV